MPEQSATAARFRQLAAKCRRLAGNMSDEQGIAALRELAAEYEAEANKIDRHLDAIGLSRGTGR